MARSVDYRASNHVPVPPGEDAYTRPAFSAGNRARRLLWNIVWLLF